MPDGLLRIDVLGPLDVRHRDEPVRVDTRKALAVLALLVTELSAGNPVVARDRVAAMLWPDADESRARAALRRTLSVLVAATGTSVLVDRTGLRLDPAALVSDVVRLRELARSDDPEDLARAVALVRGEFLAGFRLRDSEPFDSWTGEQSGVLRRELGAAFEKLVLARMRRGELHAGLADATRWLELDPLHEPAHRSVIRLLAWTGRRQDALDHYRRCVRVLAEELGVAPVRATTAVYDAVRTGTLDPPGRSRRAPVTSPAAGPASPPAAPAAPTSPGHVPMVGRDEALAVLRAARPGRVVVVSGEAGVGRTRLVEEFAGDGVVLARAHEGETGLSFAPITDLLRAAVLLAPPQPPEVAGEIARVLPDVVASASEPAPIDSLGARDRFFDAVLRVIAASGARAVVIDDVHATGPAAAELLAYLVRRVTRLPGALVLSWRDPGLQPRHPVRVALAGTEVTVVRLGRLAPDDVAALVTRTGSDLDPASLHAETAGLPMLVAESLRAGRSDLLSLPVRDLLAARLAEVSEEAGQVLGALAVLGGVAATPELQRTSGRGELETVEAIEAALAAGLVREEGDGVTFAHDALRRVAYDQLSLVRRRLLHARAAAATASVEGRAAQLAHHWHEAGRDDLAVPAAWAAAQDAQALYAHEDALRHLDFVVGLGGDGAEVALAEGDALVALGRYEQASAAFERAASLAAAGPDGLRARIERRGADVHARAGEWISADAGLAAAQDLLRRGDDAVLLSRVLADRAAIALRRGDVDAAAGHAVAARAARGDPAYAENVSGLVELAAGRPDPAAGRFAAALEGVEDVALRAALLNNLARAQAAAGASEDAVRTASAALELGGTHGDRHRLAALHANLADRLHEAGRADDALEHLKTSAALFAEVGADPLDRPEVWTLTSW